MSDFFKIQTRMSKKHLLIFPEFQAKKSKELMIRGSDFYAIWDEAKQSWSTDPFDAVQIIDQQIMDYYQEHKEALSQKYNVLERDIIPTLLVDATSGAYDSWVRFIKRQMPDNYHNLDERLVFQNNPYDPKLYSSHRLSYSLTPGDCPAWNELLATLYSKENQHKLEWAIGAIVSGDSVNIQKFVVLYGSGGTGKSTILNIIEKLFDGYWEPFNAKELGSNNNSFSLSAFKTNPLVGIQHDGDLSRIEDNTKLNSLISHETQIVNEKFKSPYQMKINTFLFMGTNTPVRITDSKSGLIRRLIDVEPTGNLIPRKRYDHLMSMIPFELGAIAWKCQSVYRENPKYYDSYIPIAMLGDSNDMYNFILDSYDYFSDSDVVTANEAFRLYKEYCEDANVPQYYRLSRRQFVSELKNYFEEFNERDRDENGMQLRSAFRGFQQEKFHKRNDIPEDENLLTIDQRVSILDTILADCPAQYANEEEKPAQKWDDVKTTLKDIDTTRLHYVRVPKNHIVIDFDLKDENGKKNYKRNLEAASKFPPTYAELSKGGEGIHLHYIYDGDVTKLSAVYADNIEVKVFNGKSSLRRRVSFCNNLNIAHISSGLPLKEAKKVIDGEVLKDEQHLRALIKKALRKEVHDSTTPNINFIFQKLEDAYNSGMKYDVTDMRQSITNFASRSTHQAGNCLHIVTKMHFKSADEPVSLEAYEDDALYFYDVEVFPNLFIVCWKKEGEKNTCVSMINPTPAEIEALIKRKLIGFNNRRYDNHILYARLLGYSNEKLYSLSCKLINSEKKDKPGFSNAFGLSYTDIYDFASAGNKKSLKKLEIEMGIHHMELGLPWDQPVPESMWQKVADYCCNDVIATEAAFHYLNGDWVAREILADLAGLTVNDTTNQLTTKFIFGDNRHPQSEFNYRNLAERPRNLDYPKAYFPGYIFNAKAEKDKRSWYREEYVGEGGYVYAEPGMYENVALLDVESMHPHSLIAEKLFGDRYTKRFKDILAARLAVKHKDWDTASKLLDGKLIPYIQKIEAGELTPKQLANALKTAINSVYGLTSAGFDNPFRDPRNIDNIVAKRGALFMIDLKHAVQEKGFTVAHIKTDSIKIPNATPEIISFVKEFGKEYGYNFDHEATYERMCLVNNAVYIARYASAESCEAAYGYIPGDNAEEENKWTATGAQFAVPYVFKTLFSHEEIIFNDLCETKSVTSSMYLDMNEDLPEGEHNYQFVGRTGQFCPIISGRGGGVLLREKNGKYSAITGTTGYRFLESEVVKQLGLEDDIDRSYYASLVDDAIATISEYGDFYAFAETN